MPESDFSICIIDDEEIDIYLAERIVKKVDFISKSYSFKDGEEAFEHFASFEERGENFSPAFILLDINMPRMTGIEFLEAFSKLPSQHRDDSIVAMLTSSIQPEDKEICMQFDFVKAYFEKPLTEENLQELHRFKVEG